MDSNPAPNDEEHRSVSATLNLLCHGYDEVIDKTLGNIDPPLTKCDLQVLDSVLQQRVARVYPKHVLSYLEKESMLATPYAVSFQLHHNESDTLKKEIVNSYSVKYDMISQYLVFIPFSPPIAIPNDMQVSTSAYVDSSPYYQTASSVL
ncbi:hypothetical protein TNCV_1527791 [Trichonephila clavipes]|nr:hypothetical protein TNCV_1527791 [Trichonephila clavipes]